MFLFVDFSLWEYIPTYQWISQGFSYCTMDLDIFLPFTLGPLRVLNQNIAQESYIDSYVALFVMQFFTCLSFQLHAHSLYKQDKKSGQTNKASINLAEFQQENQHTLSFRMSRQKEIVNKGKFLSYTHNQHCMSTNFHFKVYMLCDTKVAK